MPSTSSNIATTRPGYRHSVDQFRSLAGNIKAARFVERQKHKAMADNIAQKKRELTNLESTLNDSIRQYKDSASSNLYTFVKRLYRHVSMNPKLLQNAQPLILFDPTNSPTHDSLDMFNLVGVKSVDYDAQTLEFTDKTVHEMWRAVSHLFDIKSVQSKHDICFVGTDKEQMMAIVHQIVTNHPRWGHFLELEDWKIDLLDGHDEYGIFSDTSPLIKPMSGYNTLHSFDKHNTTVRTFNKCKEDNCCLNNEHILDQDGNAHIIGVFNLVLLEPKTSIL